MSALKDMLVAAFDLFELDADTLTEEEFVAKHGELVRLGKHEVIIPRDWYRNHQYNKYAPDEPLEAPLD